MKLIIDTSDKYESQSNLTSKFTPIIPALNAHDQSEHFSCDIKDLNEL